MTPGDWERPDLTTDVSSSSTATHDKNGRVEGDSQRDWEFLRVGFVLFSTFHHLTPKLYPISITEIITDVLVKWAAT